jgi:hypothetical protein
MPDQRAATENLSASLLNHLMNMDRASGHKDAKDKEARTPRSRGRSVVVLYDGARTHPSLEKDAPVSRAVDRAPGTFFVAQPCADCITNLPGSNLRQVQPSEKSPS